jgi:hypothetical protein
LVRIAVTVLTATKALDCKAPQVRP